MSNKANFVIVESDTDFNNVELIGIKDESPDADARAERVQSTVARMIVLGQKKGRPLKEEKTYEDAAA